MSKKLSHQSSLENFKREAKRWLNALRENDPEASARFESIAGRPAPTLTLRDVQHALALEYGFAGWSALTDALADRTRVRDLILGGPISMFDAISYDRVERLREIFDRSPADLNQPVGKSLQREPDPHEGMQAWWTPLAFAITLGKPDAVRRLIELGAGITVRNPENRSLLEIAVALRDESPSPARDEIVHLLDTATASATHASDGTADDLLARFLTNACPDHRVRGGWSHAVARDTAARLLEHHPEIARANIYTAVVCGDIDQVRHLVAHNPDAARTKGGPKGSYGGADQQFIVEPAPPAAPRWEPLLYLCYARLDTGPAVDNAVAIAELLLDSGADPNAYFMAGDSRYSPLSGVVGEGEEARLPHARRDELARLLLDRGANPYDMQLFYNIHFNRSTLWYLTLAYEYSVKHGRKSDWDDPQWSMIGMGGYGDGAHFLLNLAIEKDDAALAEWCLAHGADPNAQRPARSKLRRGTLHEEAIRNGRIEIAELLARYGATTGTASLSDEDRFVAAALQLDRQEALKLVANHPEFLRSPKAMFAAASHDRDDAVALLLDLGTPIEVEDDKHQRTLHIAAYNGALHVMRLLIDRGAEIDPVETNWNNTPLDAAIYGQQTAVIDLLGRYTSDVWSLTFIGSIDRLREVLAEHPGRAKASWQGTTLLMRLPGDADRALQIAKLLLSLGADPTARNRDGLTAADIAEKRGLDVVTEMLRGV
ncbi:MAG: ankyrin repeat domain-containing protein [bacterium]